jgi:phenylacetic acid degradation operon negative regulatory protein
VAPDLWIRPNNLAGGVSFIRGRLRGLGLDAAAPVFRIAELDAPDEARACALWDGEALGRRYRETQEALAASRRRLGALPLRPAMVESFTVGGRAIRQIVLDPLLPAPLVDTGARHALLEDLKTYDRLGRERWREFLQDLGAPHLEEPLEYRLA